MSITSDLNLGLRQFERLFPDNFLEFKNLRIPCSVGEETRGADLVIGGRDLEANLDVIVRRSAINPQTGDSALGPTGDSTNPAHSGDSNVTPLKEGDFVMFRRRKYKVGPVVWDAFQAFWQIRLNYHR